VKGCKDGSLVGCIGCDVNSVQSYLIGCIESIPQEINTSAWVNDEQPGL
jgi:hypothetical protein